MLECSPSYLLGLDDENRLLEKLSDVVRFVFELDRTNELKFNIDVKKPPSHNGWECSITFDGKNQEGKLNTDFCLFLEEFEKMRSGKAGVGTGYGRMPYWKEKTLAYYSDTELTQRDEETLLYDEKQQLDIVIAEMKNK